MLGMTCKIQPLALVLVMGITRLLFEQARRLGEVRKTTVHANMSGKKKKKSDEHESLLSLKPVSSRVRKHVIEAGVFAHNPRVSPP